MKANDKVAKILSSTAYGVAMALLAGLAAFSNSLGEREKNRQHEEMWKAFQDSKK